MRKAYKPSNEHALQQACVTWFRTTYPYLKRVFYAVPNGGYRGKATASKMKMEGVQAGISDLNLDLPNGTHHALRIEMKDKSVQSTSQKLYQMYCGAIHYRYEICHSLDSFQFMIEDYLSTVDKNIISALQGFYRGEEEAAIQKAREELQGIIAKA